MDEQIKRMPNCKSFISKKKGIKIMPTSYNLVDQAGLNYAIGEIATQVKAKFVAKADEKTALSQFTNDANYVADAAYVHTDANFTTAEKEKLSAIAAGAQVNVIESVKVNGSALTPDAQKAVDITVPTALSDLTNDNNTVTDASYVHTDNNYTTAEKEKLSAIAAGAQVNVIESVKVNGTALTPDANKAVDVTVPTKVSDLTNDENYAENVIEEVQVNGVALSVANKSVNVVIPAAKTALSEFTNDMNFQTDTEVEAAIDAKITSAYRASGSVAFASLPALTSANANKVYNITDGFTTTADFMEGAGKVYGPGANVAIVLASSDPDVYKYDVMADFVDLSGYLEASDVTNVTNAQIDTMIDNAFNDSVEP